MENRKDGGPAYPSTHSYGDPSLPGGRTTIMSEGMSLRDHLAGLAMQSYIQVTEADWHARRFEERPPTDPVNYLDEITEWSYQAADAMLKAREQ